VVEFRVLGPLEVVVCGRAIPLSGIKQRATLGLLLLNANRVVATNEILNNLWPPGSVPSTARKMLQNAVSALRSILAAESDAEARPVLLTHPPGYLLHVDPEHIDITRFDQLIDMGRSDVKSGSLESGTRKFREALALWRGPVLADLVESGVSWPELAALRDRRLSALEDCYGAELARGRHREVIAELKELVKREPTRERLGGQLMLALYRDGRQVEALNVFRNTRCSLVDQLGLEPGRELTDLERAILRQDESLDLPAGAGTNNGSRGWSHIGPPDILGAGGRSAHQTTQDDDVDTSGTAELASGPSDDVSSWAPEAPAEADILDVVPESERRSRAGLTWNVVEGDPIVVDVEGELDISAVTAFRALLVDIAKRRKTSRLIVNMTSVGFMDSTGVGALVSGFNASRERGLAFEVHNPSRFVAQALRTTGLEELLVVCGDPL
jgi:anti-anti-sigma factor